MTCNCNYYTKHSIERPTKTFDALFNNRLITLRTVLT